MQRALLPILSLILWLAGSGAVLANDEVALKDGSKLAGKILSETEEFVVIEVRFSPTIVEEKVIPKSEVAKITRPSAAETAFEELKSLAPGPNSLSVPEYKSAIEEQLEPYLKAFPGSPREDKVKELIGYLQGEMARVEHGDIKVDGRWIPAEEVDKRRSEIESHALARQIRKAAEDRTFAVALNAFDRLEKNYPGSEVYPDLVIYMKSVLKAYKARVSSLGEASKREEEQWERGVQLAAPERQQALRTARAAEISAREERAKRIKESGLRWVPSAILGGTNATEFIALADTETSRLATLDVAAMKKSLAESEKADQFLVEDKLVEAKAAVEQAQKLWPANARAMVLAEEIRAAAAAPSPTPTATPGTEPAAASAAPAAAPAAPASRAPAPAVAVAAAEPESKPFFLTVPGAISIVVVLGVVIGAISILGKSRPKHTPPTA